MLKSLDLPDSDRLLVSTPDNPIPDGATTVSIRRRSDRGLLRVAHFAPSGKVRGTVALFHGRAEFIEKYFETISDLLARGFCVATMDWRGQGGSERELAHQRKGHIADFELYQRDLDRFLCYLTDRQFPRPWLALAHSMGGAILLEHAYSPGSPFQRLVLTAPMIDIAIPFRRFAPLLAASLNAFGFGERLIPFGKEFSKLEFAFEANKLTSDPVRFARTAAVLARSPRLAIGDPTIGWVNAAFEQIRRFEAPAYARNIRTPCMLVACGSDQIVSTPSIAKFAGRMPAGRLVPVDGARHEILIERDRYRAQFWVAFDAFAADLAA